MSKLPPELSDQPEAEMRRMSRRSFVWAGIAAASAFSAIRWLDHQPLNNGIPWPFRRALALNEKIARAYFRGYRLAPEFDGHSTSDRTNGDIGLDGDVGESTHVVQVTGLHDMSHAVLRDDYAEAAVELTVAQIKAMPAITMLTELKCIEGWSIFVQWKGARLADLIAKLGPATRSGRPPDVLNRPDDLLEYVGLSTPDDAYYVGLDMAAALHPQTLLCYEMNGAPLTSDHGAPLRLVIPVKYGVKNIKRIGAIRFTSKRPKDYWAEQGYDWYAGF
jgi:hypothetical protein